MDGSYCKRDTASYVCSIQHAISEKDPLSGRRKCGPDSVLFKGLAEKIRCFSRGSLPTDDMIPANRSISMASLDHFVAEVSEKWRRGDIHNTGGYSTVKFDALIGPMYQVCEQVITPMTADPSLMLPGVSWAQRFFTSSCIGQKESLSFTAC